MDPIENLLHWCRQAIQYFMIKQVALGLTETEAQLLAGLQEAVDRVRETN